MEKKNLTLSTTKKSLNFNSAVFAVTGRAEVQNRLGRKAQHNKGSGNSPTSYMTGKEGTQWQSQKSEHAQNLPLQAGKKRNKDAEN